MPKVASRTLAAGPPQAGGLSRRQPDRDRDQTFCFVGEGIHANLQQADGTVVAEKGVHCCYAKSDKYWVTDPQGIAWESFRSLGSVPLFGGEANAAPGACGSGGASGCCAPAAGNQKAANACCA